jgi:hypothetical protein
MSGGAGTLPATFSHLQAFEKKPTNLCRVSEKKVGLRGELGRSDKD